VTRGIGFRKISKRSGVVRRGCCVRFFLLFLCGFVVSGCGTFFKKERGDIDLGEKITDIALAYKGCPYRYGGTTPKGFDCSGFTAYVFKEAGISIPRTAKDQWHHGRDVAESDLKEGDLVFFTRWGLLGKSFSPWHVGIYIGDNQFIHAPSTGKAVQVDSLDDPSWRRNFKGARDLL